MSEALFGHPVPHALTAEQPQPVSHAKDLLEMIENNPDFANSIITRDKSRCFTYDPLTKRKIVARVGPKSQCEKKSCFQKLKIKTMLIPFFDSKEVVHIQERQTSH